MSNYSKSKSDALRIFKENANNFSLWTIYELGKRNPVFSNLVEGDENKTIKLFEGSLSDLYPDKIYTVKMYKNLLHRKTGQKFIAPNFEFSFQFDRAEFQPPVIAGVPPAHVPPVSPYAVDVSQRINLSDHIQLIGAKSKAESDCQYYLGVIADGKKTIADLQRKVDELEAEVSGLEDELDEMEESEEENEKAKIAGESATTMESAIASIIKENGGVLLENLLGKKGVQGAPDFSAENISGEGEEVNDEKTVNGITSVHLMELPFSELDEQMLLINPNWKKHLCKLILIGQQKPATFKMFMSRLEAF